MSTKKKITKTHLRLLCLLLPVISALAFLLPFLSKFILNKVLSRIENYFGHADGVSFGGLGKSISIKDIYLDKKDKANVQTRFLSAETITLTIDRIALWKGFLVLALSVASPRLFYIRQQEKEKKTGGAAAPVPFIPAVLTQLEISNGEIEFSDPAANPRVEIKITGVQIEGKNMANIPHPDVQLPTEIKLAADIYEGALRATVKADLSPPEPAFDLNAELKGLNLVKLNNFFKAYGKFDVNKGTLSMFTEVAAKEKKFEGYIKPEVFDLDVLGPEDYNKNFLNTLWQSIVGATAEIFQNQKEEELATKIPFSGSFKAPHVNIWFAVADILYNAFVEALKPSIDYEININSVKKTG